MRKPSGGLLFCEGPPQNDGGIAGEEGNRRLQQQLRRLSVNQMEQGQPGRIVVVTEICAVFQNVVSKIAEKLQLTLHRPATVGIVGFEFVMALAIARREP